MYFIKTLLNTREFVFKNNNTKNRIKTDCNGDINDKSHY